MASPRPDKAGAEMLGQSLAHQPAAAGECPDSEILAAYFERSLNAEETARCELHLSGCARCREELALVERASRDAAVAGESTQAVGRRAWVWDWRWLAPVAAALIVAAIWIVLRPSNSNRESQQPLVAMSQPSEPPAKEAPAPSGTPAQGAPSAAVPKSELAQNRALDKKQNAISRETIQPSTNEELHPVRPPDARRDADSNLAAKSAGAHQSDSQERAARTDTESNTRADDLQPGLASPAATAPPAQAGNAIGGIVGGETDSSAKALKSKQQMAAPAKPTLYAQRDGKAAQASGGIGAVARVVRTPDPKVLWQITEKGILKSEDGAATWRPVDLPVANAHIVSIAAPSAQVCWLVGRDSLILLTTDGTHWQSIVPPAQANFVQVVAENASSATVATAKGLTFGTPDAGEHWHPVP